MSKTKNKLNQLKTALVTLIFGTVIFGVVLSQITANVLFVERIGAQLLPQMYIINAILSTFLSLGISISINRIKITKLINIIAAIGVVILSFNFFLIKEQLLWSYPLFFISSYTIYIILGAILIWDLAFKIYSPYNAKQKLGLFSLGSSIGGIIAGLTSSLVTENFATESLIPVLIISLLLLLVLVYLLNKVSDTKLLTEEKHETNSFIQSLKAGFSEYKKSKLAKLLSLSLILYYTIRWLGDYQFQKIVSDNFNETQFAQISGYVSIIENIGLIIVFLLIQKRVLKKFGLMNTLLAAALLTFIPFSLLLIFPIVFMAATLRVSTKIIDYGGFTMPIKLVFTAIPQKNRSKIISFIGSNTQTGGIFIAGLMLLILTKILDNQWIIAIGACLALVVAFLVTLIKKEFTAQIARNLQSSDPEDVESAIENYAEASFGKIGIKELMKKINHHKLPSHLIRKIIFALGKIDDIKVIPSLLKLFDKYDITVKYSVIETIYQFSNLKKRLEQLPFTRLNIIDTYKKIFIQENDPELKALILKHITDLHPEEVILFLINIIQETDKEKKVLERNNAIRTLKDFHDRGIIRYIEPFLADKDIFTRASSIIALWQFPELRPELLLEFNKIINDNQEKSIICALEIIGELKLHWEQKIVKKHLKDKNEKIKALAAITLLKINDEEAIPLVVKNIIEKNKNSNMTAKNLKNINEKIKNKIIKKVKEKGEDAVKVCIKNLEDTYFNFSSEIEILK